MYGIDCLALRCMNLIRDIIKRYESDVANIDFELQAERGDILAFYIVLECQGIVHISATRCPIETGVIDQSVAF